ncbi:MAG: hypothetical protein LBC79_07565 [Deltaproteobacteria bacterium]|jgi:hypothetical protein|nr:hypothetical protein [Deltaproteobacteria bacterium]
MAGIAYSHDFQTFAKQIVWFGGEEQQGVKYPLLAFLMARGPRSAYDHARRVFGFTDEDFREALRQAKAGVFMYQEVWERWNTELGFVPPLPFPKRLWLYLTQEQKRAVKEEMAGGGDLTALAEKYRVSRQTIEETFGES